MSAHLTYQDRLIIQKELYNGTSFKKISILLSKDCTTISKEIKRNSIVKEIGSAGRSFNNCAHRSSCSIINLCSICNKKYKRCRSCSNCLSKCSNFSEEKCPRLASAPYVCNGCHQASCTLTKFFYDAIQAENNYQALLKDSRSGLVLSHDEIVYLNSILTPLIKQKGQSIHHAYINNLNRIMLSEKTLYKIIDLGLLDVRNIDLPRKVRFRTERLMKTSYKVDKTCLEGRRYEDYLEYMKLNLDTPIVQMDSVVGRVGGKVLLTLHFVNSSFMLAFIRDHNDAQSVIDIFNHLRVTLGSTKFKELFPICLTDNGSEFSNPIALETDPIFGEVTTKIFYCHPSSPYEKGSCEVNHELLRRIFPKGSSFDHLSQEDINKMMSHINSYKRKKLNDKPPHLPFSALYGSDTLELLGIKIIDPNEVNLTRSLINK